MSARTRDTGLTSAILTIAYRDLLKFLRDRPRIVSSLVFPVVFIVLLGGTMQSSFQAVGVDLLLLTFTGIYAQTLFQSTALGLISLIADRESDFSQEIFVSPISRYAIVAGKIVGETAVSLTQGLAIVALSAVLGVALSPARLLALLAGGLAACLLGGAFGVVVLSRLETQRAANQIFPFLLLPQFFLAGVFVPITTLPLYLEIPSLLSPLRYAVDLTRGLFYEGPTAAQVVAFHPALNLAIMTVVFALFLVVGTWSFVRAERNR